MKKLFIVLSLMASALPSMAQDSSIDVYCVAFDAASRKGLWIVPIKCSLFASNPDLILVQKQQSAMPGVDEYIREMTLDADGVTIHIPIEETEVKKVVRDIK